MTRFDELGYPVVIDARVDEHVQAFVRAGGYRKVILLADRNLEARATPLARSLRAHLVSLPLGERRKNARTLSALWERLAALGAERGTLVIGVGGGVAGDLFGFAAATYMRGVPYAHVATSLVSMVDASIGGKTGIDLAAGKNLAGAFRDPRAVFCDIGALATLPDRQIREGLAEVVKHGVLEGGDAFSSLETLAPHPFAKWPWEAIVADSVRIKAAIVNDDKLEHGARELLNLGHTFAHAIEQVTSYRTAHGAAVAIGLRAAGLLALRTGRYSEADHLRVLSLLALLRLPLVAPTDDVDGLLAAMAGDKKTRDGTVRFVVPRAIGDVEFGVSVPKRTVRAVLNRLHEGPGSAEFR
jgi:3-dehydroquinate synthase